MFTHIGNINLDDYSYLIKYYLDEIDSFIVYNHKGYCKIDHYHLNSLNNYTVETFYLDEFIKSDYYKNNSNLRQKLNYIVV